MKIKVTLTAIREYEVVPKAYGESAKTITLDLIKETDEESILEDPFSFIDGLNVQLSVAFEEVK